MFLRNYILIFLFTCTFQINAQSSAGTISGSKTFCDTINSGFLSVTGHVGNVVTWLLSNDGGINWTSNGNTFTTQSYVNLKKTICYKVVVKNGAFLPDTSLIACNTIYLPTVKGTIVGGGNFCGTSGNGTLTLNGHTGNILNWESSINGGLTWSVISNTSTTLPYTNFTQNKLYRAIVQNGSFCLKDTTANASFVINPNTVSGTLSLATTNTVCYANNSSTINLTGQVGNIINWISSTDNESSWTTISNTTPNHLTTNLTQTTLFKTIVRSANCTTDTTAPFAINVLPQNTVNAGSNISILEGESTTLTGSGNGSVLWLPINSNLSSYSILNPIATPNSNTNYILTLTDVNSCTVSDTVFVTVISKEFKGIISNVISPNGDGINDSWYIENINYYPNNEVSIYNIYGQVIYTKKGYQNDWEGTYNGNTLPDGTYFYIIQIDHKTPVYKGTIDILKNK